MRGAVLSLIFGMLVVGALNEARAQDDNSCCDPQSLDFQGIPLCNAYYPGGNPYDGDDCVSDPDCEDYDATACTIPLDGGLSLLALAGGGLATAAMRRRREEEEAAAQSAA